MRVKAFPWYGGKTSKLSWLLAKLPYSTKYIEPFGGSAAVLLNRNKSHFEVYNDINSQLTNFFSQLRNNRDRLITHLMLTHHNRQEFELAINYKGNDKLELARLFYVKIQQGFMAKPNPTSTGDWARVRNLVRREMNHNVNNWLSGIERLIPVYNRLKTVSIENRPAIKVIEFYDSTDAVIYCDPPYLKSTRNGTNVYTHEMTEDEHIQLAKVLNKCKAQVAISGYPSKLYADLYRGTDWFFHLQKKHELGGLQNTTRQEALWTNYDFNNIRVQQE